MIKVAKFGGSSVANADQYRKIKKIVDADEARKIIVASACGKESKEDHKVTDLLYLCEASVKYGMDFDYLLGLIEKKHQLIASDLGLKLDVSQEIAKIGELLKKKGSIDEIVSRGEYLSSKLLAEYLGADFIDAKDVIFFNYDGSLNLEKTKEAFLPLLSKSKKVVVPGFYGSLPNGTIKVMSRGGSDITGAILANVIDADIYENWTDVSGMLVCDPRIIDNPKRIEYITYAELREMSYMGANVLHDEAIFPVKQKKIPINVRNTNEPDNPGTMIVDKVDDGEKAPVITGITGKKDFSIVSISKGHISSEIGFLRKALEVFENYKVPVVSLATGVDSFSVVIANSDIKDTLYGIIGELKNDLQCEEVKVVENVALVCIVGRGMTYKPGSSGQFFGQLGKDKVNIKTISQDADEVSIIIGVNDDDYKKAIESIYNKFVKE